MQSKTQTLKPLLKWSGGKYDELPHILKHVPACFETYIEPFFGSGAVFFALKPTRAVINDTHCELVDFYKSIKDGYSSEINEFMQTHQNDEKTYYEIRDDFEVCNQLNNAKRFYYLRKTCYRGMLRYNKKGKFNIPYGRYKKVDTSNLLNPQYESLLKSTDILNCDFETLFEKFNDTSNFMFLDPPYDSPFNDYGCGAFDHDKQARLATLFKSTKNKCLMIIGKTPFIQELYKDYIVEEYSKKYRFRIHSDRVNADNIDKTHLIVKNYT
jgi:DNA adenine methylase